MSTLQTTVLSATEARDLTDRINRAGSELYELLAEAHEGKAWEALGYSSWREYATAEFSISQSYAYRLLDRARMIAALADAGEDVSPMGERQARELKRVPKEKRVEVWREAVDETNGKPTAAAVKRAAEKIAPPSKPEIGTGQPPEEWIGGRPDSAEDVEPAMDPLAEWERAEREVTRLEQLVETFEGDTEKELAALSLRYAQLEGRVRELQTEANEAKSQAKRNGEILKKIAKKLKVERWSEILPALEDLLR